MTTTLCPLPTPTAWDIEHLKTCHSSVRVRRLIELGLIRKMVVHLIETGFSITVNDGGDDIALRRSTSEPEIMDAIFAVDEATLILHEKGSGKRYGYVTIVLGNSGWDAIADYAVNLDTYLQPISDYAEALSAWA